MKRSTQELDRYMSDALAEYPVGTVLMHYKGGIYVILGHVIETDNARPMVRYRRIGGPGFNAIDEALIEFVRPLREFDEEVVIDGPKKVARFARVN